MNGTWHVWCFAGMGRSATDLTPKDVDRELIIYFTVVDEIKSSYFLVRHYGSVQCSALAVVCRCGRVRVPSLHVLSCVLN